MVRARALLAGALVVCAAAQAPGGYSPVSTGSVCPRTTTLNVITNLPRYTLAGQAVSSDLGSYRIFECSGANASRSCGLYTGFTAPLTDGGVGPSPSTWGAALADPRVRGSVLDYGQGIAWYAILNLAIAILVPLCAAVFIAFRYCCCCCRHNRCTCLRCGTPWPTRKAPCCGFTDLSDGTVGYPTWERVATMTLMLVFIAFATAMVIVSNVAGNYALGQGMINILAEGDTLQHVAMSAVPPAMDFLIGLTSTALAPALVSLNATVASAVVLDDTVTALSCVNATLHALPNPAVAVSFLAALSAATAQIAGNGSVATASLGSLSGAKAGVLSAVGNLQAEVTSLGGAFGGLTSVLDATIASVNNASYLRGNLTSAATSAQSDLATVPRVGAGGSFPDVSTLSTASGAPGDTTTPGTMQRVTNGWLLDGNTGEITTLVGRLQAVLSPLAAAPNYTATAGTLSRIASLVASSRSGPGSTVARLRASLGQLQAAVGALPSNATVDARVDAVTAAVDAVNLAPLRVAVAAVGAVLDSMPPFGAVLGELGKVTGLQGVLPCVATLSAQLTALNDTVVRLPSALDPVTGLFGSLNGTIMAAVGVVADATALIASANASIAAVNVSGYLGQVDAMNASLAQQKVALDPAGFKALVNQLAAGTTALDFAGINATVDALESALVAVDVSQVNAAASALAAWGGAVTNLILLLRRTAAPTSGSAVNPGGDYVLYARGYCSGNSAYYCDTNPDCVVGGTDRGPCTGNGLRRCSAGDQSRTCGTDADCVSPGTYCLADSGRAVDLTNQLLAAQGGGVPPDVSPASSALSALLSSLGGGSTDPTAALAQLSQARAAVAGIDVSAASATLASIASAAATVDISGVNATLAAALAQIAAIPYSDASSQVSSVQGAVDTLTNTAQPIVDTGLPALSTARGVLYDELPVYVARMGEPNLRDKLTNIGPSGAINDLVTGVADRAVAYINSHQAAFRVLVDPLQPTVDKYTPYVDKAVGAPGTFPDTTAHGAAYYFGMLAVPDKMVPASNPHARYLLADDQGTAYASGQVCATRECVTASLTVVNSGGASTWRDVAPDVLPALPGGNVPLSREHVLLLLWAPPVIVILLCLFAISPLCKGRGRKVTASCAAGCMVCQVPWIFIVTALLWPFIMVSGDVCASGPNVGANYVASYGDTLCPTARGSGTVSSCAYSQQLPVADVTLTANLDFDGTYRAVMSHCPPVDPLGSVLSSLADQLEPVPYIVASKYVGPAATDALPISGLELRPALTGIVFNTTNTTGALLSAFIKRAGAEVLSCGNINAVASSATAAYCCDVLPPLFWIVSGWYLVGWAMLLCGLPAACLGRKRLVANADLWGPAYTEALQVVPLAALPKVAGPSDDATAPPAYDTSGAADAVGLYAHENGSSSSGGAGGGELEMVAVAPMGGTTHRSGRRGVAPSGGSHSQPQSRRTSAEQQSRRASAEVDHMTRRGSTGGGPPVGGAPYLA